MADLSITVQNTINSFGPAPSSKWGTGTPYNFTWGTSLWGEGSQDLITQLIKVIGNSISSTDTYVLAPRHVFSMGSISSTMEMTVEYLTSNGWNYVFTGNVTDADERNLSTWSDVNSTDATWTATTDPSTSWSDA